MEIQFRSYEAYVRKIPGFEKIVEQTDNWAIGEASGLRKYKMESDNRHNFYHQLKNPDDIPYGDVIRLESEFDSMKVTISADINPEEAPARADSVSTPDDESMTPNDWIEITFSEVSLVSSKMRHNDEGLDHSKSGYSIKFTDDYRIHLTDRSRVKSALQALDTTQAKAPGSYNQDMSLSEPEALALVRFLRASRGEYSVHLPYKQNKPYYRARSGGGFLTKEANTDRKEHVTDEKLIESLKQATAVTVVPRNETPQTVWGTIHPEDSEVRR